MLILTLQHFWRNRSNQLEDEHVALEANISRLQQNDAKLQAEVTLS